MKKSTLVQVFAAELARWRELSNLTQAQLAEKAGVCTSYVSMLERGQRDPSLATIERLAKALDVPPAGLLVG